MRSSPVLRATAALLATGAAGWLAVRLAAPVALGLVGGPATFEQAVTGTCGLLLLGCTAWLVVVVTTGFLAGLLRLLPPRAGVAAVARALDGCTPAVVRGVVATTLGLSVAAGVAGPALADPTNPVPASGITGLALPDRAVGAGPGTSTARRPPSGTDSVVVRAGDTLWAIARAGLPVSATDAETAAAVHRLYAANRSRIGTDPDLILPGTPLVLPDRAAHHRKDRP